MTFRVEYAEKMIRNLTHYVRKQTDFLWETDIHVSTRWHFTIQYETSNGVEKVKIIHKHRPGHVILAENGKIIKQVGIRRFDMLFAALDEKLISALKNQKTFKITRKKLNERYLIKTPYFWSKIEYYLQKKEDQKALFELFGDRKYKTREERIKKAIQRYIKEKREFIEHTKKMSLV